MAKDRKPPIVNAWPAEGLPLDPTRIAPKLWDDYDAARAAARDPSRTVFFVRPGIDNKVLAADAGSYVLSGFPPVEKQRLAQRDQKKAALDAQLRAYLKEDGRELWARHGSPEAPPERVLASIDGLQFDHENRTAKAGSLTLYGLEERQGRQASQSPSATITPPKLKRPKGPQADRVLRVLPELYRPHGVVPPGIAYETVRGKVADELASENEQRDLRSPGDDCVSRCVKYLRALHA